MSSAVVRWASSSCLLCPLTNLTDVRLTDYRDVPDPVLLRRTGCVRRRRPACRSGTPDEPQVRRPVAARDGRGAGQPRDRAGPGSHAPCRCTSLRRTLMSGSRRVQRAPGMPSHRREARDRVGHGCGPAALRERRSGRVLEAIGNADNIGGIFRNSAAFGVDAVLLSPGCCDPLYRKAIRVSIGGSLAVPYGWCHDVAARSGATSASAGSPSLALTPSGDAVDLGCGRCRSRTTGAPRPARRQRREEADRRRHGGRRTCGSASRWLPAPTPSTWRRPWDRAPPSVGSGSA